MKLQQSKSKGKENMNDTREKKIKWKNAQMPEMNVKNVNFKKKFNFIDR